MGSAIGLHWPPDHTESGMLAAFGGGALIAALAVELIAPVAEEVISIHTPEDEKAEKKLNLAVTLVCSILGGCFFVLLDQIVSRSGGVVRGYYTTMVYYAKKKQKKGQMLGALSESPVFATVALDELRLFCTYCKPEYFSPGTEIFQRGKPATKMYVLETGKVEIVRAGDGVSVFVEKGGLIGEIALLSGNNFSLGSYMARGHVNVLSIQREVALNLLESCPSLSQAIHAFCLQKLEHIVISEKSNLKTGVKDTRDNIGRIQSWPHKALASENGSVDVDMSSSKTELATVQEQGMVVGEIEQSGTYQVGSNEMNTENNFVRLLPIDSANQLASCPTSIVTDPPLGLNLQRRHSHSIEQQAPTSILHSSYSTREFQKTLDTLRGRQAELVRRQSVCMQKTPRTTMNGLFSLGDVTSPPLAKEAWTHQHAVDIHSSAGIPVTLLERHQGNFATTPNREPRSTFSNMISFGDHEAANLQSRIVGEISTSGVDMTVFTQDDLEIENDDTPHLQEDVLELSVKSNRSSIQKLRQPMRVSDSLAGKSEVAPLAVWLGILLDGIPESIVIGLHYASDISDAATNQGLFDLIPYTLIAGLFLSNFPEALSSSLSMHKYGWSRMRVFLMWTSLTVITSIGAGLGYALNSKLNDMMVYGVQGLAAGAMLTMIASAMIPEALHTCGSTRTGLSVLMGFVVAVAFKMLE
eukprot:CAMPEP_0196593404 /NCGR_PEP_ID=MMETSP1081-20130531/75528_1 /TAXON_ID=36882 /ORGANISM="Pyramimonas amylifera, Strain CCMP720" /LENGTH=696 /DNA_ID=CAMNT_0041917377 /DNA_START=460 /DNA_END=2550 /DNA_ORIENTATION=-